MAVADKDQNVTVNVEADAGAASPSEIPYGVFKAGIMRQAWTRRKLIIAFGSLILMNFAMTFNVFSANVYEPYATSHFQGHSLITTASIIMRIIQIVALPVLAKTADVFGRSPSFISAACILALANVLYATCTNVETFLSGGIFESLGDTQWTITQQVFVADVTSLLNRGLWSAIPESIAAIPTLYAGSYLGEAMLDRSWRWGYAMWAFILPVAAAPVIVLMLFMERRTKELGLENQSRLKTPPGSPWYTKVYDLLWVQLDLPGAFLLIASLSLVLLPLSIAGSRNTDRWRDPSSIACLVVGVAVFVAFLTWDTKYARHPIIPYRMIKDRNTALACSCAFFLTLTYRLFSVFFPSFLQVAGKYSPGHATRLDNSARISFNAGAILAGLLMRFIPHTKPFMFFALPVVFLAHGLLIYFVDMNGGVANEASFVVVRTLTGLGRGTFQSSAQVVVQASNTGERLAVATAVFLAVASFGSAIGDTIAGAIWTELLPRFLRNNLPEGSKEEAATIFGSLREARAYEPGSEIRLAIDLSYRQTIKIIAIATVCLSVPYIVLMAFIQNVRLKPQTQEAAEEEAAEK